MKILKYDDHPKDEFVIVERNDESLLLETRVLKEIGITIDEQLPYVGATNYVHVYDGTTYRVHIMSLFGMVDGIKKYEVRNDV